MPTKTLFLLALTLSYWLGSAPTHAARIYNIVDYPDFQNGHTLSGTITTTDEAPDDGLLVTEEILDWEWSISGPNELSASFTPLPPFEPETLSQGITISPSAIEMPRVNGGLLSLSQIYEGGRGLAGFNLSWFSRFDESSGMFSLHNSAGRFGGDFVDIFWNNSIDIQSDDGLTIATVVPEPSTLLMFFACLLTKFTCFRGKTNPIYSH